MLLSKIFIGLASMASLAVAAKNKTISSDDPPPIEDLGTVLATHKNLTEYYNLVQKYPEVLMQLPSYDGVTIIAPSDAAFKNIPFTSLNHIWDPEDGNKTIPYLQYMILQGTVSTQGIEAGPTFIKKTILTNSTYTNVTDGQNIGVVKQPEDVVVFLTSLGTRCTVIEKDIRFAGGLIQIVDNLLIPPARLRVTAEAFGVKSFLGGLYAADILPDLADEENVTIFAPKDAVMENVGGSLEKMDAKQLARTMGYHVVPGQVIVSSGFKNGTFLETLARDINDNAQEVLLQQIGNNIYINSAQIVQPDILMANGIMHIINGVLNPAVVAPKPNPKLEKQPPVFNVSSVEDMPFTTAIPCTQGCPETATEVAVATTSYHRTRTSKGVAPMITANIAGAAIGMVGLGAGMGWL